MVFLWFSYDFPIFPMVFLGFSQVTRCPGPLAASAEAHAATSRGPARSGAHRLRIVSVAVFPNQAPEMSTVDQWIDVAAGWVWSHRFFAKIW